MLPLYLSINWPWFPKWVSNCCATACLLSIIPNDWLQFLTAWSCAFLFPQMSFCSWCRHVPQTVWSLLYFTPAAALAFCVFCFRYEWLCTFVLWISWLQTLKDFYVPKRSCYRFYPAIWCAIWPTDGTDETTLQAVNVDSQNRKLEENI